MKTTSLRDLRYSFKKVEHLLRQGEEVQITKRRHVIATDKKALLFEPRSPNATISVLMLAVAARRRIILQRSDGSRGLPVSRRRPRVVRKSGSFRSLLMPAAEMYSSRVAKIIGEEHKCRPKPQQSRLAQDTPRQGITITSSANLNGWF